MANTIRIDQFAATIAQELVKYSKEVVEKIDISSEKIGKTTVAQLKQTSPKQSGDYAKAWAMKTEKRHGETATRIIHVKPPHYRLTHLLEYGHAKVNGGRVDGKPHIRPAEEKAIEEFTREVEEAIRRG